MNNMRVKQLINEIETGEHTIQIGSVIHEGLELLVRKGVAMFLNEDEETVCFSCDIPTAKKLLDPMGDGENVIELMPEVFINDPHLQFLFSDWYYMINEPQNVIFT